MLENNEKHRAITAKSLLHDRVDDLNLLEWKWGIIIWDKKGILNSRPENEELLRECRPVELKKIVVGDSNYEILSATMLDRRRKLFISNRLKGLGKRNICRRKVI